MKNEITLIQIYACIYICEAISGGATAFLFYGSFFFFFILMSLRKRREKKSVYVLKRFLFFLKKKGEMVKLSIFFFVFLFLLFLLSLVFQCCVCMENCHQKNRKERKKGVSVSKKYFESYIYINKYSTKSPGEEVKREKEESEICC